MYCNQEPMLTHWRHMYDRGSFVDAQATRLEFTDLTGIWRGNDGSVYYIRYDDPHVWWAGFSDNGGGQTWTHVFHGIWKFDETVGKMVISGNWADVPRGTARNNGTLVVALSGDRLTKVAGAFSTTTWERTHWRQPAFDLTGTWRSNDGGIYYIRHLDNNKIWWVGLSDDGSGHNWTNVLEGEVSYDNFGGVQLSGVWFDVPRGTNRGNGIVGFEVRYGDLVKNYENIGFGTTRLKRIS